MHPLDNLTSNDIGHVKESLVAYERMIESAEAYLRMLDTPTAMLFMMAPPLDTGGFANMPSKIEAKCVDAVKRVIREEVAVMKKNASMTRKLLDSV